MLVKYFKLRIAWARIGKYILVIYTFNPMDNLKLCTLITPIQQWEQQLLVMLGLLHNIRHRNHIIIGAK